MVCRLLWGYEYIFLHVFSIVLNPIGATTCTTTYPKGRKMLNFLRIKLYPKQVLNVENLVKSLRIYLERNLSKILWFLEQTEASRKYKNW